MIWSKAVKKKKKPFLMIFRIAILPDGSLRILNASKSDEGKYICRGENVFGSAEITATVSVKGKKMWWIFYKHSFMALSERE